MARKTKEEKLESIEEQIKRLQEQRKKLQTELRLNVGKTLLEEWEVEDEQTAIYLIQKLKDDAKNLLSNEKLLVSAGGMSNE